MRRLCIVTGLNNEAACLRPHSSADYAVIVAGTDPDEAIGRVRQFANAGCSGLISFGTAGGLIPQHTAGDIVLPESIVSPSAATFKTDAKWRQRLADKLEQAALTTHTGRLAGSCHIVATPSTKRDLHAKTQAVAVDMESHVVAALAHEIGVRFLVVRVITDTAGQAMPHAFKDAISTDGTPLPGRILAGLAARPWELPRAFGVATNFWTGIKVLRRVALLSGAEFGLADLLD